MIDGITLLDDKHFTAREKFVLHIEAGDHIQGTIPDTRGICPDEVYSFSGWIYTMCIKHTL